MLRRRDAGPEVVRSLYRPNSGLLIIAIIDPVRVTSARFFAASCIPTRSSTFNARVDSNGARNTSAFPANDGRLL
jgi:hypothetical protein